MNNKYQKVLYIKYGELCLKGKNRHEFTNSLNNNLKWALKDYHELKFDFHFDYILITNINDNDLDKLINIIRLIPGFAYISLAYQTNRDIEQLANIVKDELIKENETITFRVDAHRSDKTFPINSDQLKRMLASSLLVNQNFKVDLHEPQIRMYLDVKKDYFLFYMNKISCENGLPVNTSGRILMLISGGIDSPVAARMLFNRGFHIDFITFITPPYTQQEVVNKIKQLIKIITVDYRIQHKIKLYICNYTNALHELNHMSKESYRINILRRSFFRIADLVSSNNNYQAIATGESLGQVASQTIESMISISDVVKGRLVLRPLLAFNKEQIINLSKKYNLYETSILPYEDSCSLFAPKNPITKPKIEVAKALEDELVLLNDLEQKLVDNLEIIEFEIGK